jgi:hypothetical protein
MLPYATIILLPIMALCLEWFREIKNLHKHFVMLFLAICFILFSGLRWECGTDWEQFYGLFYSFRNIPFTEVFDHRYNWITGEIGVGKIYEPGYALMNWLFVNVTDSFNSMLVFYTTIIIFIYYKLSWLYTPRYPIYIFAFLITGQIFFWRAGFATTICFFSIQYIVSRKFFKFLLCCIIATSMHNSAILFLPFYFILNRKFSYALLICMYLCCSFIGNTSILYKMIEYVSSVLSIFSPEFGLIMKLINYLDVDMNTSVIKLVLSFCKYGIFVVIFCLYRKYFEINPKYSENGTSYLGLKTYDLYNAMLNAYVIASCIWMLFRTQMQVFIRFALYFGESFIILNVLILSILPKNKRRIFLGFVILNILYIAFGKFLNFDSDIFFPYKTIFDR